MFALAGAKTDEREVAAGMISINPDLHRPSQILIADKGYRSKSFGAAITISSARPAMRNEEPRAQTAYGHTEPLGANHLGS